jgi:hypothetical protein
MACVQFLKKGKIRKCKCQRVLNTTGVVVLDRPHCLNTRSGLWLRRAPRRPSPPCHSCRGEVKRCIAIKKEKEEKEKSEEGRVLT